MSRVLRTFREMLGLVSRGEFSRHLDAKLEEALAALEECWEAYLHDEVRHALLEARRRTELPSFEGRPET